MQEFEFARASFQNAFRDVPEIITPRLFLRGVRSEDANELYRIYSDAEVARYDNFEPMTRVVQATAAIETFKMEFGAHERVRWVVTQRLDRSALVGSCWMGNFDIIAQRCEIGYELLRSEWNRGYGSELVASLTSFAFRSLGLNRVEAYVDAQNAASRRVLEKSGFTTEGELRERDFYHGEFHNVILYALLAVDSQ